MAAPRAAWMVGSGAIATVLVALPYKAFDLDRYFVPKELVLHLTAVVAATIVVSSARRLALSRVDTLLVAFLALSAVSAGFAQNGWLATRSLAISCSSIALFWTARALARAGYGRVLLGGITAAITAAAVTLLLQAYGVRTELFSLNRAPGGTLGNRNFLAHLLAIGLPALVLGTLTTRRHIRVLASVVAAALIAAALVLSRSRAAWLAIAIATGVVGWQLWRLRRTGLLAPSDETRAQVKRCGFLLAGTIVGVVAAMVIPNTLHWKSRNPYLDSALGLADYREGSGRGRLLQYHNTARLALEHPLLGVGPGNWPVAYPRIVPPTDPSLDRDSEMTSNPWPSSDWAATLSERGILAFLCLMMAFVGLVVEGARGIWRPPLGEHAVVEETLVGLALFSTVIAIAVVGAFDAVLLLPAPALIAWSLLGTLDGMVVRQPVARFTLALSTPQVHRLAAALIVLIGGIAAMHSAAMALAMAVDSNAEDIGAMTWAAKIDPGTYRIQVTLATLEEERRQCRAVRIYASRAHALFPEAPEPVRLLSRCGAPDRATARRATR